LELLKQKMAQANMVPANAPITQIKGLLDVFVANAQLHYETSEQQYPVNISLFRAQQINPHYNYGRYDDTNSDLSSSSLGWREYTKSSVNIRVVGGDHITMLSPEYADSLASHINPFLTPST
jgi:thioesterase domain-containing protein